MVKIDVKHTKASLLGRKDRLLREDYNGTANYVVAMAQTRDAQIKAIDKAILMMESGETSFEKIRDAFVEVSWNTEMRKFLAEKFDELAEEVRDFDWYETTIRSEFSGWLSVSSDGNKWVCEITSHNINGNVATGEDSDKIVAMDLALADARSKRIISR